MKKEPIIRSLVVGLALATGGAALAQTSTATPPAHPDRERTAPGAHERGDHDKDGYRNKDKDKDEKLDDESALRILMAINEHEMAAAELALERDLSPEVKEYAERMVFDHNSNNEIARPLVGPGHAGDEPGSWKEKKLRQKFEDARQKLATHQGDAFERAYIDAMVKDHAEALELVNRTLLPATHEPINREHMERAQRAIGEHYQAAQGLQREFTGR